jgi:hypothetical protein
LPDGLPKLGRLKTLNTSHLNANDFDSVIGYRTYGARIQESACPAARWLSQTSLRLCRFPRASNGG